MKSKIEYLPKQKRVGFRTRLQVFEDGTVQEMVHLGIATPTMFMKFIHYKEFLVFRESNNKTTAIKLASDHCKCNERTMWEDVKFVESSPE